MQAAYSLTAVSLLYRVMDPVLLVGAQNLETFNLTEEDVLSLPDYRRKHLFFSFGKKMLGLPERPTYIPETRTVRLEEREDGSWEVVDSGCGPGAVGDRRGGPQSAALQPHRMVFADLVAPLSLQTIVTVETERMLGALRGSSEDKNRFVRQIVSRAPGEDEPDSRIISMAEGYFVRVNSDT